MKDLIGIKVQILIDGMKVEGVVIRDLPDRVLVKGTDGKISRVVKKQISMFIPEREPEPLVPLQLLFCNNSETGCSGVKYIVEGENLTRPMFEAFMKPCPHRQQNCRCGTHGDMRTVSSVTLKATMCGILFGDYPEKKEGKK